MALDDTRRGQLALLVLQHKLRREGVKLGPGFMREIGNAAKEIGIPFDEAKEFIEELTRGLVDEIFADRKNGRNEIPADGFRPIDEQKPGTFRKVE